MSPQPFDTLHGVAAPIDMMNVDTDQLAPVRFLRRPRAEGYGDVLFHDLRAAGGDEPFVLERRDFRDTRILVAGTSFGVGSSREQAVWALVDHGVRCVLAESFGDIFFNNAVKHGLLLIRAEAGVLGGLRARLNAAPGTTMAVDLEAQTWSIGNDAAVPFEIESGRKRRLRQGLDELAMSLQLADRTDAFAAQYRARRPWLFRAGRNAAPNEGS